MKISLVIPVYNKIIALETTLQSIIKNSKYYDEIIMVNDASTDGSIEFLKEAAKFIEKIKIIDLKENVGPFQARVIGIRASRVNWVHLMDADDLLLDESGNLIKKINNIDGAKFSAIYFSNLHLPVHVKNPLDFIRYGWPDSSNIVVRKSVVENIKEESRTHWGEDHIFFANLIKNGWIFYECGKIAEYRKEHATRSRLNGDISNRLACTMLMHKTLCGKYPFESKVLAMYFGIKSLMAWGYKSLFFKRRT